MVQPGIVLSRLCLQLYNKKEKGQLTDHIICKWHFTNVTQIHFKRAQSSTLNSYKSAMQQNEWSPGTNRHQWGPPLSAAVTVPCVRPINTSMWGDLCFHDGRTVTGHAGANSLHQATQLRSDSQVYRQDLLTSDPVVFSLGPVCSLPTQILALSGEPWLPTSPAQFCTWIVQDL